jgi:hypothetical protein
MLRWQEEVYESNAKWIVARVCRRGGKTFTAVNWAVSQANKSVLFVVPYESQVKLVAEMIRQYKGMIYSERGNRFGLNNNTTIEIVAASQFNKSASTHGMKVDKIVVDEAGFIDGDCLDSLAMLLAEKKNAQMLLVTSTYTKGSIMDKLTARRPSSALYVSYDYVDMLRDQEITPAQVFEYQNVYSKATFAEEFGPYTTFDIDNQMMEHVLRSLDEYV